MRKLHILFIAFLLLVFYACKEDEATIPSNITNVRAEAREGAIMLRWNNPEDNNFLYVQVEYVNLKDGKLIKKNVSSFSDSLLIKNILRKDGEYSFTLRSVSGSEGMGEQFNVSCTALRRPAQITEYSEKINFEVSDLSANASDPDEGNLADLIDGNLNTFYHTNWHENIPFPQWIQFNLPKPIEGIKYISWNRKTHNQGNAYGVSIQGSNDGVEWETLGKIAGEDLPSEKGAKFESPIFSIEGKTFTKIRYNALEGYGGNSWFHMAELELYKAWYDIDDPEAE